MRRPMLAIGAVVMLAGPAGAETFSQPYPCSVQASGDSHDCSAAGLGEINGCVRVDGVLFNTSTKPITALMVTVLVDDKVVANVPAAAVPATIEAGQRGPYAGAVKYEVSQAVKLTNTLYGAPKVECLISVK